MKAILEFDLPEDVEEHTTALNGWKWKAVCRTLETLLRDKLKYREDLSEVERATISEVRDTLNNLLEGQGISLFE